MAAMKYITQLLMAIALILGGTCVLSENKAYIDFQSNKLIAGKKIWLNNCEGCHGYGIATSPNPLKPADWQQRINKDIDTLYDHAINGFFGPDDTLMPARGGNQNLTDNEVRRAVDYMKALAGFYINKKELSK